MPYGISQQQPDCDGWAAVYRTPEGSYETLGCHKTKQDAIDQMVAAALNDDEEIIGEVRAEGYKPTGSMKDEAQRGLDWRTEYNRGGTEVGVARARDIINGRALSLDTVQRMSSYFARHEVDKQGEGWSPEQNGYPSAGRIAWALWGGDPGRAWADNILKSERQLAGQAADTAVVVLDSQDEVKEMSDTTDTRGLPPSYRPSASEDVPTVRPSCATCEYFCLMPDMEGGEAVPHCHRWGAAVELDAYCDAWEAKEDEGGEAAPEGEMEPGAEPVLEEEGVRWIAVEGDERKAVAYTTLEMRAATEGNTLVGYAAVFDSPSEPMPFREFVRRGAFTKTLKDGADVRLLIDHEGVPLARTKSGTLQLIEDERGLRVEAELDPTNPDAARIMSALRRGDLSQMSFAFRVVKDSWNKERTVRELREVQLYDVSVVTFPAYEATVAELRGSQEPATMTTSSVTLRKHQVSLAKLSKPENSRR